MNWIMKLVNMLLRLLGMGKVAKLNSDIDKLHQQVASGNYQGAMASSQAISGNAAAGNYGGQGAPQVVTFNVNPFQNQAVQNAMVQGAMTGAMASHQRVDDFASPTS